jgi:glycosyltransferase involved in cell wall biosynthesis
LIENEKDGLLEDKNDHIAMGNKILRLLSDSALCKTLSTNARAKAQTYAWDEVKKDWNRVIKGAIDDA